jgi:hypothetical protein
MAVVPDGVRVRFLVRGFEDKFVSLAALRSAADPMAALFTALGATPDIWRAFDTGGQELTGVLLRSINDTNFLILLHRKKRAGPEHEAGGTATPTNRARTGDASGFAAGAGKDQYVPEEWLAEKWPAPPTYRLLDGLGEGFPRYNAILELIDNGVRALVLRAPLEGAATVPLELRVMLWSAPNLKWCLSVRDTGIGMPASHVPIWATLGGDDGLQRPNEWGNPCHPDGACMQHAMRGVLRLPVLGGRHALHEPGACAAARC